MYVPSSELQQYKGQWFCPICLQEARAQDTKFTYNYSKDYVLTPHTYSETCERCGRETEILYIWNDRKLCKTCLEEQKLTWDVIGGGPSGAGQVVSVVPIEEEKKESFVEHIFSEFLGLFGVKKKKKEEEVVVYQSKMPIDLARPMTEGLEIPNKSVFNNLDRAPRSEGPMGAKKKSKKKESKKKKSRKAVSFPEYKKKAKEEKKEEKENPFRTYKDKKKK